MQRDIKEIDAQRSRWIDALNQSSADGFVEVITDDAVWLPSGSDAIHGKAQVHAWLEKPFAELTYQYAVHDVYLRIAGAWAVEHASFETRVSTGDGTKLPPHRGNYTLLWRKEGAGWLIERYIDNSAEFVATDFPDEL